ncbi:MAG: site-specific integrase [Clostridia bacterium]|nr:site-specific integrase [Clostridia bacterium]
MLELLEKEPIMWKTLILVCFTTGMRRGEICGLKWSDISLENAELNVVRTSQYIPKKGIIDKEPKTRSSIRVIDLPAITINALKQYKIWYLQRRLQVGEEWIDTDKVFCQWNGNTIHPDSISDYFHKFVVKNNFEQGLSLHSLRHSYGSLLLASGSNIKTVSSLLGHAQTSTTANIYVHEIRSKSKTAVDNFENMLLKNS